MYGFYNKFWSLMKRVRFSVIETWSRTLWKLETLPYSWIFLLVTMCLFQEDIIDFHDFVPKFFVFQSGRTIKFGGQCLPNLGFRIPPCQLTVQVTYGAQGIIIFPKTFSDLWNNHSWIQQLGFRGCHVFVSFLKKGKVWLGQNRGLAIV